MKRTQYIVIVGGLCVLVAAGWFWFAPKPTPIVTDNAVSVFAESQNDSANTDSVATSSSPFAVQGDDPQSLESTGNSNPVSTPNRAASEASTALVETRSSLVENLNREPIDVTALGHSTMEDAAFESLVNRLRDDPALLQQLIDEFRQETDESRRANLSQLLGEVGGADVTLTASELIYSGDPESRRLGLELLQQIQPGNAQARDIASSLLATEIEPKVLVDTLTTLAKPGAVDDASRDFLSDQVAFLTTHEDATVRGISLNILSRWSTDGRYTPVLLEGLTDVKTAVRESAAFALVGHEDESQEVIDSLFNVAMNTQEDETVRRASIYALKGMGISDQQRQTLVSTELELDTVRR